MFKVNGSTILKRLKGEFIPALIGEQLAQRTGLKQGDKNPASLSK